MSRCALSTTLLTVNTCKPLTCPRERAPLCRGEGHTVHFWLESTERPQAYKTQEHGRAWQQTEQWQAAANCTRMTEAQEIEGRLCIESRSGPVDEVAGRRQGQRRLHIPVPSLYQSTRST
jgi:hypothetical protein